MNFGRIVISLGHPRKNLGGVIEAVIDEVVQADVVIPRQTHGARSPDAPAEKPGSNANGYESQGQKNGGQFKHSYQTIAAAANNRILQR